MNVKANVRHLLTQRGNLTEMTSDDYKAGAEGFYRGAILVADFMQEVHNSLLSTLINPSRREENTMGMFLRALAWMRTLKKLDEPVTFQAMVACNRALLEITIDLILLHNDKTDASWWKMHSWEQSAKLKIAEELKKYYASQGLAIPDKHTPFVDFIRDNKTFIEHARLQLWPNLKGKHPSNRWTGAPGLLEDAQLADRYWGSAIKDEIGTSLTEFYQTEYRRINLNIHGSALAGIRGIPQQGFYIICGLTFKSCTHFAVLCTKIILNDYDFAAHYPELNSKWEELKQQRELAYANARGWLKVPNEDAE